jgi:predicted hotdog family 3-hydroxylacyl-ACP dehydratase
VFPPIETLIPHRPPMRWIDALTQCGDASAQAVVSFDKGHFAVANGFVLETALVESIAQTVAAAEGHRAQTAGTGGAVAAGGMLVAVSSFSFRARVAAGNQLRIETRALKQLGPMLLVSGSVWCDGEEIASGELMLYV